MKKVINEGQAKILIDEAEIVSRELEAFYNPKMALNRDFSIAIIKANGNKEMQIGLPLAGTGVRAVRMLIEIPEYIKTMQINDLDPKAIEFVKENLKLNNIKKTENINITNLDGNKFLMDGWGFDYIDIDPFGSPNFMLDSAIKYISRKGVLAISATDTSALAGTYPNVCKRKYFANSVICPQKHEIGIRILIRKAQLMGLHNERELEPIFSYHYEHYYRIFFRVRKSKDKASKLFSKLETYHHYCEKCCYQFSDENKFHTCPKCNNPITPAGPMYSGALNDKETILKLINDKNIPKSGKTILENIKEEMPLQEEIGSYDTHDICKKHKFSTQSMELVKNKLIENNFETVICATIRTAIKTEAPFEEVINVLNYKEN